jgi:hypothetical protein
MVPVSKRSLLSLSAAVLALAGTPLLSAENETYVISAVAIQDGNQVLITARVSQRKTDGNAVLFTPRMQNPGDAPVTVSMTMESGSAMIQDGNKVWIRIPPPQGKTDGNAVLLFAPRILIQDGHHATLCMEGGQPGARPQDAPDAPLVWEGLQVDVTKAVGQDHVICVLTVFSKGLIVFAKTENVKVTPGRIGIQGPTTAPRPATRPRRESKVTPGEPILPRPKGG